MPRLARPSEISCNDAAALAVTEGCRVIGLVTPVLSFIRLVALRAQRQMRPDLGEDALRIDHDRTVPAVGLKLLGLCWSFTWVHHGEVGPELEYFSAMCLPTESRLMCSYEATTGVGVEGRRPQS